MNNEKEIYDVLVDLLDYKGEMNLLKMRNFMNNIEVPKHCESYKDELDLLISRKYNL